MKKKILAALLCLSLVGVGGAYSQGNEYRTVVLTGTADMLVDSTLKNSYMDGKRLFINGIYWWYDNGANTNQIYVEVIQASANFDIANSGRQFKYSEAMTSGGIKGTTMPMALTTGPDSTIFFKIQAASSDTLYMAVNYRFVGK